MNDLFSVENETALRQTTVIASTDFNVLSFFDGRIKTIRIKIIESFGVQKPPIYSSDIEATRQIQYI